MRHRQQQPIHNHYRDFLYRPRLLLLRLALQQQLQILLHLRQLSLQPQRFGSLSDRFEVLSDDRFVFLQIELELAQLYVGLFLLGVDVFHQSVIAAAAVGPHVVVVVRRVTLGHRVVVVLGLGAQDHGVEGGRREEFLKDALVLGLLEVGLRHQVGHVHLVADGPEDALELLAVLPDDVDAEGVSQQAVQGVLEEGEVGVRFRDLNHKLRLLRKRV